MTIHIMLDLETWGTEPGCDIRSIGACVFDPMTGHVCDARNGGTDFSNSFYRAVDNPEIPLETIGGPTRMIRTYPLTRDPRTEQWWSDQSAEAQAAFADAVNLRDGLIAFAAWYSRIWTDPENKGAMIRLWSHGPSFDPPILAAAFKAVGLPVPWHYRAPRDTRTAFDMAGIDDDGDGSYRTFMTAYNTGTYHHALDDAIAQAKSVCGAYERAGLANVRAIENIADPHSLTPPENLIRDHTLEFAAGVCEGITSWGLPPTKLEVADSTKAFCAKVIRAQKSDSPERIAHEAKTDEADH